MDLITRLASAGTPLLSPLLRDLVLLTVFDGRAGSLKLVSARYGIHRTKGIAVRFPRMLRIHGDKKIDEADTLETLKGMLAQLSLSLDKPP